MSVSLRKIFGLTLAVLLVLAAIPAFADGQSLYRTNCANCHANDGSGKTSFAARARVPDLRSREVQDLSDEELYTSVARGTRHKVYPHGYEMRGMSKPDIKSLVEYLRSIKR